MELPREPAIGFLDVIAAGLARNAQNLVVVLVFHRCFSNVGENLCPDCSGSGRVDGSECATCGGSGKVVEGVGGA
jgi:hypothetical protein